MDDALLADLELRERPLIVDPGDIAVAEATGGIVLAWLRCRLVVAVWHRVLLLLVLDEVAQVRHLLLVQLHVRVRQLSLVAPTARRGTSTDCGDYDGLALLCCSALVVLRIQAGQLCLMLPRRRRLLEVLGRSRLQVRCHLHRCFVCLLSSTAYIPWKGRSSELLLVMDVVIAGF